jgi:glutathione S-transferase
MIVSPIQKIAMYDLAGADPDRRFSPYCWRTRLALAHKGLPVETIPWRFTDKAAIAFSGQDKVPVIVDGGRTVHDSWTIAEYLEDAYPDRPSLFGGAAGRGLARFVGNWADSALNAGLFRQIAVDIPGHLAEQDLTYFRESREKRVGMTLDAFCADRESRLPEFRRSLAPLRQTLAAQPFLAGEAPSYADYAVLGSFQWARCVSPIRLLEPDDPVHAWRARLLAAFDGLAGKAKGYEP